MQTAVIQQALLHWYAANARDLPWRRTRDPYAIWVSEVMCQQTRVTTVLRYFDQFLQAMPDVWRLASASDDLLQRLWQGLGYYRRATLLRRGAQFVAERFHGQIPASYDQLRMIPGMGDYTAGAVASIAFGLPVPAIDGNVVRVFSRWYDDSTPADRLRTKLRDSAQSWVVAESPGVWNQALMELGALVCLPHSPRCNECPVKAHCCAYEAGTTSIRPVKGRETRHEVVPVTVFVHVRGDNVWVERRPETGLLAGLWGFPVVERETHRHGTEVLRYRHVFTHRTWVVSVRVTRARPTCATGHWVSRGELSSVPLPTAFRPIVRYLAERSLFESFS